MWGSSLLGRGRGCGCGCGCDDDGGIGMAVFVLVGVCVFVCLCVCVVVLAGMLVTGRGRDVSGLALSYVPVHTCCANLSPDPPHFPQAKQKELDRRLVNNTRLRTGRLAALFRLQADVGAAVGGVPVHLIADGPADFSSGVVRHALWVFPRLIQ